MVDITELAPCEAFTSDVHVPLGLVKGCVSVEEAAEEKQCRTHNTLGESEAEKGRKFRRFSLG